MLNMRASSRDENGERQFAVTIKATDEELKLLMTAVTLFQLLPNEKAKDHVVDYINQYVSKSNAN